MTEQVVRISTDYITLDAFLKWTGVADTGGHAKTLIASSMIKVNGEVEQRRGRKLRPGDHVMLIGGGKWIIAPEGE